MTGERGQASIEVIAFLPLVVLVALVIFSVIAAHAADEQAGEAAEAGALMLLQGGGNARDAASDALPKSARRQATITVSGHRVHVAVRAHTVLPIPGLADLLAGEAQADAGSTP
jgi:hypothetical protein